MLNIPQYQSYTRPVRRPQSPTFPPRFHFNQTAISNLSPRDQALFQKFGQGPRIPVPYDCLHHAFEAHAILHPNNVAVQQHDDAITYRALNRHANRLAAILAAHGVTTGDNVGLFLRRSIPMVVGIIATLKAGAAYVPQDVHVAPQSQLEYVIDTARTNVILTLSHLRHLVPAPDHVTVIAIDDIMAQPFANKHEHTVAFTPEIPVNGDNTCFIIFTSGTTGKPNGVQVTHANVGNILLTAPGHLGMRPGVKVAQILSIAFDMAAWETLGAMGNGATLIIRGTRISCQPLNKPTSSSPPPLFSAPSTLTNATMSKLSPSLVNLARAHWPTNGLASVLSTIPVAPLKQPSSTPPNITYRGTND